MKVWKYTIHTKGIDFEYDDDTITWIWWWKRNSSEAIYYSFIEACYFKDFKELATKKNSKWDVLALRMDHKKTIHMLEHLGKGQYKTYFHTNYSDFDLILTRRELYDRYGIKNSEFKRLLKKCRITQITN